MTKVEVSARHPTPEATCTVIDGCTLLWIPQWSLSALDFVKKLKHHILKASNICLFFDKYVYNGRVFWLSSTSPLLFQKVTLTITQNKKELICKDLQSDTY